MAKTKAKTTKKVEKTTPKKATSTKKKEIKLNPLVWEVPYNEDLVTQVLNRRHISLLPSLMYLLHQFFVCVWSFL